ncbi:alpha/beta-hydrolase [Periconia macrospinosa]|uniref:Alpha/beta-hydrolase n=1 Tax=Periconia macrospinosa TaxID=97972 RepID=A0A2V1DPL0_9PLEO|nr:alpha/beta-hydrolase [Periconia macrospinosa]
MALKDTLLSLSLLMGIASVGYGAPLQRTQNTTMTYDFKDIKPSRELNWQPCFESFKCTKLTVPLQYDDPEQGDIDIAYIRYDSKNGSAQDIMYNPGGPGASGVDSLIDGVESFVELFGTEYNFVSFDPRGVNNSGSSPLSCGNTTEIYYPPTPMNILWKQSKVIGESCTKHNADTTAKFTGTVANVQDMIYFTELQAKANKEDPAKAKIWYVGISYGTIIGQTLAALYPERLGRIILDSNADSVLHYTGYDPTEATDLDVNFEYFFKWCSEAGSDCPLATNTSTASDIRGRYDAALKALDIEPAVVSETDQIITRIDMERKNFDGAYTPTRNYYAIAKRIADFQAGNLTEANFPRSINDGTPGDNSLKIINCVDAAGSYPFKTLDDYETSVNALQNSSNYWWNIFAFGDALQCNGMKILPPKSQTFLEFKETKTSIPILFLNNLGDPITPIKSAFKMSKYFPGSRVLAVDAPGHVAVRGSKCVLKYARSYLKDGSVPPENTVCGIEATPTQIFNAGKKTFEIMLADKK